ncbi:hypothetical protein NQ652_18090, partial [Acinetobacter baumannii]|nr:hypothetical protein [Acinetobacter baumannii]
SNMSPAITTKNPAPAETFISVTLNTKSFGLPNNFGSSDIEAAVLDIQIGKFANPFLVNNFIFSEASSEYSISLAPYISLHIISIFSSILLSKL